MYCIIYMIVLYHQLATVLLVYYYYHLFVYRVIVMILVMLFVVELVHLHIHNMDLLVVVVVVQHNMHTMDLDNTLLYIFIYISHVWIVWYILPCEYGGICGVVGICGATFGLVCGDAMTIGCIHYQAEMNSHWSIIHYPSWIPIDPLSIIHLEFPLTNRLHPSCHYLSEFKWTETKCLWKT